MSAVWFLAESGGAPAWALTESAPSVAPTAPSGVAGVATGATTATIGWTDASSDEAGFDVQIENPNGSGNWVTAAGSANPTAAGVQTFSATGLPSATVLRARVRAFNVAGASGWTVSAAFATDNPASGGGEIPTEPEPSISVSRTYTVYPDPALPGPVGAETEITPTYIKDPESRLDYTWQFAPWLADAGDSVASMTVTLGAGITSDLESVRATSLTKWVLGPPAGTVADMRLDIVTSLGRVDSRTIRLQGLDR